jgi:hypothetical protein
MHGLGKSLPKGEALLVPFFCDVFVSDAIYWEGDRKSLMEKIEKHIQKLANEGQYPDWE